MFNGNTCIYEYEQILLGKQNKFELTFLGKPGSKNNQKEFGQIWRYAIENIMHWNAQEALAYLTTDIVKKLKLDTTYYAIDFNPAVSFIGNYKFALQYAFPDEIKYDFYNETIDEYNHVSKKMEWANDDGGYKYHKNFFQGVDGYSRGKIIVNYVIQTYLSDTPVEELYDFFANKSLCKNFLEEHRLAFPANALYGGDILSFFHYSYRNSNNFYYYEAVLARTFKKICKNKSSKKQAKN